VRRVAQRYMKGIRFAYVGDPSKLKRDLISLFWRFHQSWSQENVDLARTLPTAAADHRPCCFTHVLWI